MQQPSPSPTSDSTSVVATRRPPGSSSLGETKEIRKGSESYRPPTELAVQQSFTACPTSPPGEPGVSFARDVLIDLPRSSTQGEQYMTTRWLKRTVMIGCLAAGSIPLAASAQTSGSTSTGSSASSQSSTSKMDDKSKTDSSSLGAGGSGTTGSGSSTTPSSTGGSGDQTATGSASGRSNPPPNSPDAPPSASGTGSSTDTASPPAKRPNKPNSSGR